MIDLDNDLRTKGTKNISTIHEFFYRKSDIKVGGSDNYIQTNLDKKASTKIVVSSLENFDESYLSKGKEKFSYSKIPSKLKSIKKRPFEGKSFYKNLTNKKLFNFRSYFLDLKSQFFKIISRGKKLN